MNWRVTAIALALAGSCLGAAYAQTEAEIYQMMEQQRRGTTSAPANRGAYQQNSSSQTYRPAGNAATPSYVPGDLPGGNSGSYGNGGNSAQQSGYPQQGNYRQGGYPQNGYGQRQGGYQQPNGNYGRQPSYQQGNNAIGSEAQNAVPVNGLPGWRQVGAPGYFSASMPGNPRPKESVQGGISTTTWESDSDEPMHLFSIVMTPYSKGTISGRDADEILFSIINSRAKALRSEATHKRRLDSTTNPGCMFDISCSDADWNYMVRIAGDTVYTLSVCSMPGQGNDQYVQQFFRSFMAQ